MLLVRGGRRNRLCCVRFFHDLYFFFACLAFFLALLFFQFGFRPLFYQQFDLRRKMGDHFFVFIQGLKRFELEVRA